MNHMRTTTLRSPSAATGLVILAFGLTTRLAPADFWGISMAEYVGEGWVENGYEGLRTVRLYAEFDLTGDDGVLSVYGVTGLPAGVSVPNRWFYNDRLAGRHTAPLDLTGLGYWKNQWDTYVTINATRHDGDETSISPGFAMETNELCMEWQSEDVGWFVTPDAAQSHADEGGRVLLAQFTVAENVLPMEVVLNLLLRDRTSIEEYVLVVGHCQDCDGCSGDVTSDGTVDTADLVAVLAAWGDCNGCREDQDCSATVDFGDLLVVLEAWGDCRG